MNMQPRPKQASGQTLRSANDLVKAGLIAPERRTEIAEIGERYAIAITPAMARLLDKSDAHDPIARQFIPGSAELLTAPNERSDPIGDAAHSPLSGIVHRYPDRVLLKLLHICPVYCRFCFRREQVGPKGAGTLTKAEQSAALAYIAANPTIWEVILTGGDPLMLSARRIGEVMQALEAMPHVRIVRFHTRVPVVEPGRVTASLLKALGTSQNKNGKTIYMAIHVNHAREFTPEARQAIGKLRAAGLVLVSQSVLLKGVNDNVESLANLMQTFVETGIKPYYLHHADLAPGTAHFRTTIAEGQALMRALHGRLSGLCLPSYVIDIPGGYGKSPIGPDYLAASQDGNWSLKDYQGISHSYRECG